MHQKQEHLKATHSPLGIGTITANFVHKPVTGVSIFRSVNQLPQTHAKGTQSRQTKLYFATLQTYCAVKRVMRSALQDMQQAAYLLLGANYTLHSRSHGMYHLLIIIV